MCRFQSRFIKNYRGLPHRAAVNTKLPMWVCGVRYQFAGPRRVMVDVACIHDEACDVGLVFFGESHTFYRAFGACSRKNG